MTAANCGIILSGHLRNNKTKKTLSATLPWGRLPMFSFAPMCLISCVCYIKVINKQINKQRKQK